MVVYKTREFARAAKKLRVGDEALRHAVERAQAGHVDAQLGAHLIKQRVAREGEGRSGGLRTVLCFCRGRLAIFLHVFPKNAKANIDPDESEALRLLAKEFARASRDSLNRLAAERGWESIADD